MVVEQEIEDDACGHGGDQYAQRGQGGARPEDGLDVGHLGVQAAGEQDGAQGHGANNLRHLDVVEVDAQTVAAEEHAHGKEQEQGRHTEAAARLARQYAGEEEGRKDQ